MKKILLIGLFMLSGCATVSEYGQGCRDGVTMVNGFDQLSPKNREIADKGLSKLCDDLESIRKNKKDLSDRMNRK